MASVRQKRKADLRDCVHPRRREASDPLYAQADPAASPPLTPDHRDGDGLNNRRGNLRPAERAQQSWNMRSPTGSTSAFKGVHWYARAGRWRSRIKVRGKDIQLGLFDSEIEAKAAY